MDEEKVGDVKKQKTVSSIHIFPFKILFQDIYNCKQAHKCDCSYNSIISNIFIQKEYIFEYLSSYVS